MRHFFTEMLQKFLGAVAVCGLLATGIPVWAQQTKLVAVTSVIEHPALDEVRDGVKEALASAGYVDGKNLRWQYQTAQGNVATAAQIARKFVGDNPAVIVAISTPSAQTVLSSTKDIPIVFSAITDPIGAKLIAGWEPSGTNVTGVSNVLDVSKQVDLIQEVVPGAKRIGVVYNPAEANAAYYVKELQRLLPERGLTLVTASAPRTVDVGSAARSLVGKVDVFYSVSDNNVVAAYEALAKVAADAKLALVSTDPKTAARGATVAMGVDYHELGLQTGRMVLRILNGEKPGEINPEMGQKLDLVVNLKAAQMQGVTVPASVIERAAQVIK